MNIDMNVDISLLALVKDRGSITFNKYSDSTSLYSSAYCHDMLISN